jgi:hypothetical protein
MLFDGSKETKWVLLVIQTRHAPIFLLRKETPPERTSGLNRKQFVKEKANALGVAKPRVCDFGFSV